ncbi:MAG: hypothetical protein M1827_005855 [Pycnora praestabilis]|nr:MAG: hypothetical protein M1827_005855 [Pycnora praestabilis]
MSGQKRFSREGFQQLSVTRQFSMGSPNDTTVDIPLTTVNSRGQTGARRADGSVAGPEYFQQQSASIEKAGLFKRHVAGRRRVSKNPKGGPTGRKGGDGEEEILTHMGMVYNKILNFSVVTRYFVYVLPLALLMAIPIIVGATVAKEAKIGGVRMRWVFTWVEIVWLSLWVSKLFARWTPAIFQFLCGIVSSGTRKYALVLEALEIPLSLAGWALASLATFLPIMTRNPNSKHDSTNHTQPWQSIVSKILAACLIASLIFLAEKLLIQLISISYHRKQFNAKIKDSKHNVYLLSLLYDASRTLFPMYCNEFMEEDYVINDAIDLVSKKGSHFRTGSSTPNPMRMIQNVGRVGDKVTSAFGNIAHEITGKQMFNPNSAHSIVVEALEKNKSSEALAKRLWMSFVVEGKDALYAEDIAEVLGAERQIEAEECFAALDQDGNGDISLDEMILTVVQFGRERHSIANSMADVDQAISVLDNLLCTIVFVIIVFVFIGFLNASFTTTLATAGTALLSMSFVFAVTAQEILGSCIFLFVKHPFDVGDRVDINTDQLTVEHISLLFTVFKRVNNYKMVQIPNIVLNTVWIENISRSKAMREQVLIYIDIGTSLEDIQTLKNEMQGFVTDKENSRDFQPDMDIEVNGLMDMSKMELKVEIRHKSNWANETIRAARRSKFMCALVLALRKVPIYGPGGGDPPLGDMNKPSYSVAVTDTVAASNRETAAAAKEAKRLIPSKKPEPKQEDPFSDNSTSFGTNALRVPTATRLTNTTSPSEKIAADTLNARRVTIDPARDDWDDYRDDISTLGERTDFDNTRRSNDLEEVRGLLRRESTKGRRKAGGGPAVPTGSKVVPTIKEVQTPTSPSQGYPEPMDYVSAGPATYSTNPYQQRVPQYQPPPQSQSSSSSSSSPSSTVGQQARMALQGNAFAGQEQHPAFRE